jgi:hypothetical protein
MRTIKLPSTGTFQFAWHLAIENKEFKSHDINTMDVPEGTGKMCQMLRDGETDIAVILTEGIVKDIVAGNQVKLYRFMCNHP